MDYSLTDNGFKENGFMDIYLIDYSLMDHGSAFHVQHAPINRMQAFFSERYAMLNQGNKSSKACKFLVKHVGTRRKLSET